MLHLLLAALLISAGARGVASTAELPAAWPEGWKNACRQFEKFVEAQERYFPSAGLEFLCDGTILTNLSGQQSLSVTYYHAGSQVLIVSRPGQLLDDGKPPFPPGTYAACLQTSGIGGSQTLYPFVWFSVEKKEKDDHWEVRMVDPPASANEVWPNERLLHFLDFHIFPKRHRDDIYRKNRRVSPDVVLAITPSGAIVRQKLDPVLEKFLRWRIYRDGRLVEKGPARNDDNHFLRSSGDYLVFVGVDAPGGFMPVSNALHFPLFPTKAGGVEVFPTVTNSDRVPDFLLNVLPPDVLSGVLSQEWARGEGYYNKTLVYGLNHAFHVEDPDKQALLSLWNTWAWKLWSGRQGNEPGDSDQETFNFAREPK